MKQFLELCKALLDLALPPRCHLCRTLLNETGTVHICNGCLELIPAVNSPLCTICGIPFEGAGSDHPCGHCLHHPPPWDKARSAFMYDQGCRDLIHRFKYQNQPHLRRPLALLTAERMAPFVSVCAPDILIPIPLHPARLRKRGFNQSILLAELLAKAWQLPLLRQGLQRTRQTRPQIELSATERAENLRNAFSVPDPPRIKARSVMLIDDVFTTGATLAECSRTLKNAGAGLVFAVTVARAPGPDQH